MIKVNDRGLGPYGTGSETYKGFFARKHTGKANVGISDSEYPEGTISNPKGPAAFRGYHPRLQLKDSMPFKGYPGQSLMAQQEKDKAREAKLRPADVDRRIEEIRRDQAAGNATLVEIRELNRLMLVDKKNSDIAPPPDTPPGQHNLDPMSAEDSKKHGDNISSNIQKFGIDPPTSQNRDLFVRDLAGNPDKVKEGMVQLFRVDKFDRKNSSYRVTPVIADVSGKQIKYKEMKEVIKDSPEKVQHIHKDLRSGALDMTPVVLEGIPHNQIIWPVGQKGREMYRDFYRKSGDGFDK